MRDGKAHLRLDRRLARRRGWISEGDLNKELDSLPDVGEKGETVDLPGTPPEPGADDAVESAAQALH